MAAGDYIYANTQMSFSARDAEPAGSADKLIKGLYHETELLAIQTAMDNQMNTNTPEMLGTLSTGTIDGGVY